MQNTPPSTPISSGVLTHFSIIESSKVQSYLILKARLGLRQIPCSCVTRKSKQGNYFPNAMMGQTQNRHSHIKIGNKKGVYQASSKSKAQPGRQYEIFTFQNHLSLHLLPPGNAGVRVTSLTPQAAPPL
jgi:hypothetical protein